jgi:two-component system sensor histidine kinase/response regulator
MKPPSEAMNRRILLIDDSPDIHADFRKILLPRQEAPGKLADLRAAFAAKAPAPSTAEASAGIRFELDSAHQGEEGLARLLAAQQESRPYALAFVDVRMPPGWDGIETIERLWEQDPQLQVVICTAYSDHSWESTFARLGQSDRLLILKKPFDPVEINQLAAALTEKWNAERRVGDLIADLRAKEQEARAYASSLETVNRALATSKAAAEKASSMKTEFLVHLSRELSQQVNGVLGEVGRLRAPEGISELDLERMDSIFHTSRYLLSTLGELSDIACIEAGRLDLEEGEVAPMEPVEQVVSELRQAAGEKGLDLRVGHRGSLPERIRTDPKRLRQILWNLVHNAIRFTDEGRVSVIVAAEPAAEWDSSVLRYCVEDTGRGIPRERMGRLFEPFENQGGVEDAGSGLGLPFSLRLARLLGGDLRVESEEGRGSRFELVVEFDARPAGSNGRRIESHTRNGS